MGIHFSPPCCCLSDCRLTSCISNNSPRPIRWRAGLLSRNDRSFPAADFQFVSVGVLEEERINSPDCNLHRFPAPPDFIRRLVAPVPQSDRLPLANPPRTQCACRSPDDSCPL